MQALMMKLMHKVKNAAIFLAQPQHSTAPYIMHYKTTENLHSQWTRNNAMDPKPIVLNTNAMAATLLQLFCVCSFYDQNSY